MHLRNSVLRTQYFPSHHGFVDVTPAPRLPRLDGLHDGMGCRTKVSCRMPTFRRIATTNVAAREAHSKLYPLRAGFQTLLTTVCAGSDISNLLQVFVSHNSPFITSRSETCHSESRISE